VHIANRRHPHRLLVSGHSLLLSIDCLACPLLGASTDMAMASTRL
jgi:hypothetical protein